jgi:hypothetical protein
VEGPVRIWLVEPCELDDRRLVAAHNEIHAVNTLVFRDLKKWLGWEHPKHWADFFLVHDSLVEEMELRGFLHHTPLKYEPRWSRWLEEWGDKNEPYPRDELLVRRDRAELLARWGGKFKGREMVDPEAWAELEGLYQIAGGCQHDGRWFAMKNGWELCGKCKATVRPKGDSSPANYVDLSALSADELSSARAAGEWRTNKMVLPPPPSTDSAQPKAA